MKPGAAGAPGVHLRHHRSAKLPDTIRLRTQRFDFARALRKIATACGDRRARARRQGRRPVHAEDGAALLIAQKAEGRCATPSALDQVVSAARRRDEVLVRRILKLADREVSSASRVPSWREGCAGGAARRSARASTCATSPRATNTRHLLVMRGPIAEDLIPLVTTTSRVREQGLPGRARPAGARDRLGAADARQRPPMVHLEAVVLQMATMEPGETLAALLESSAGSPVVVPARPCSCGPRPGAWREHGGRGGSSAGDRRRVGARARRWRSAPGAAARERGARLPHRAAGRPRRFRRGRRAEAVARRLTTRRPTRSARSWEQLVARQPEEAAARRVPRRAPSRGSWRLHPAAMDDLHRAVWTRRRTARSWRPRSSRCSAPSPASRSSPGAPFRSRSHRGRRQARRGPRDAWFEGDHRPAHAARRGPR